LRQVDIQALSVDEAVRLALEQLGRTRDQVKVEVLATDPNGDEVLVRVTTLDADGPKARDEISPRQRRVPGMPVRRSEPFDRGTRPDRDRMHRPPRTDRYVRPNRETQGVIRPGPGTDIEEEIADDYGNRTDEGVLLDSSLQAGELGPGDHATPQDAIAPVAAEILQKILLGMKVRGRIVRREPAEEGEAAFPDDQDSVVLNVVGLSERDQNNLIGRRGETLDSLQFLLNLILGRKVDLWARVIIDVEGYRLRRKLALMNLARRTAEQVQHRKQAIPLEAMPAYERRIIHMTLSEHPDVTTESSGAEPERRVVVLPK
jgi:spoIIIJ-associated protein